MKRKTTTNIPKPLPLPIYSYGRIIYYRSFIKDGSGVERSVSEDRYRTEEEAFRVGEEYIEKNF